MALTTTHAFTIGAISVVLCFLVFTYAKLKQPHISAVRDDAYGTMEELSLRWRGSQPHPTKIEELNIDSCRKDALRTLFAAAENVNITADQGRLQQARICWKNALAFYLSYPVDFGYGSHVIPLVASLWVSDGAILELGSGWYSTPVAHRISDVHNRTVLTADSKYAWLKYFLFFSSARHDFYLVNDPSKQPGAEDGKLHYVNSWSAIGQQQQHWGFIFVDHAPAGQRIIDLQRLRKQGDLFLIHDTEPGVDYLYKTNKPLSTFKYRTTFGPGWAAINTDAVSDTRPELIYAVKVLCQWSTELLKYAKEE